MRSKAIFMALLALAFQAQAVSVSSVQAKAVAEAWARSGQCFGQNLSGAADGVRSLATSNGTPFYAVNLKRGGTVFVSADTTVEPILAFSASSTDGEIDERSPLWALLNRDLPTRYPSPNGGRKLMSLAAPDDVGEQTAAERKWERLLAAQPRRQLMAAPNPLEKETDLDDLRVKPLLETQWGQDVAEQISDLDFDLLEQLASLDLEEQLKLLKSLGIEIKKTEEGEFKQVVSLDCFNYYTPTCGVTVAESGFKTYVMTNRHVCGCVATAMAQLMYRWQWPQAAVGEFDNSAFGPPSWLSQVKQQNGTYRSFNWSTEALHSVTGKFDWANMPKDSIVDSETNCQAVGMLTYNCGVAVGMNYGEGSAYNPFSSGISTKDSSRIPTALRERFGYASALLCEHKDLSSHHDGRMRTAAICSNLDAGCPVLLLITGNGGHAVVGDGYGFNDGTSYVHLNMGWSGQDDVWYNLPLIPTPDNWAEDYDTINGVVYNVFPETNGVEIVSGHVTANGAGAAGATVSLYDGETLVATTEASETGVYSFYVESGKAYRLVASKATDDGLATMAAEIQTDVITSSEGNKVGNSWGNDLRLGDAVRIGASAYPDLDVALAAAGANDEIVIHAKTAMDEAHEIDFVCSIFAADDAEACPVTFGGGAGIQVKAGGCLSVSNVVWARTSLTTPAVAVEEGGLVRVAGLLGAGADDCFTVETAGTRGIVLGGALATNVAVVCDGEIGSPFGLGAKGLPIDTASATAARFVLAPDGALVGRAVDTGDGVVLKWAEPELPLEESACYFVDAGGVTNTATSVDALFLKYETALEEGRLTAADIVVRTDVQLQNPIVIKRDMRLCAEEGVGVSLSVGELDDPAFTVIDGTLTLSGMTVSDSEGKGLFVVNGETAELVLEACDIGNVTARKADAAAVRVLKGSARVVGSVFSNCSNAAGSENGHGGAAYVAAGAVLSLEDVSIGDCFASYGGGGVYVDANATLNVCGEMSVIRNASGSTERPIEDNVFLFNETSALVAGSLGSAQAAIGVCYGRAGDVFARYEGDAAAEANSVRAFFRDGGNGELTQPLEAEVRRTADVTNFVWQVQVTDRRCTEGEAVVSVGGCGDDVDGFYATLEDAIEQATPGAVIRLLRDVAFTSDLTLDFALTLCSTGAVPFALTRQENAQIFVTAGGAANVTNLTLSGGSGDYGLIRVDGGSLALLDGATVRDVNGSANRAAGAVTVVGGGTFTMEKGSSIADCKNEYVCEAEGSGSGSAVLVDNGTANLRGGRIAGCRGYDGAVFIGSEGELNVSGDLTVEGNVLLDGNDTPNNVVVRSDGRLVLTDVLTGHVGFTDGYTGDGKVFGRLADVGMADDVDVLASAHRFTRDDNGDVGMVVKNGDEALLVWSAAIKADGSYREAGKSYAVAKGGEYEVTPPVAATGLVYGGNEQVGVPEGYGYVLSGESVAVDAGDYQATATLRPGFAWAGGSQDPVDVPWSIAKAVVDVRQAFDFADATYTYSLDRSEYALGGVTGFVEPEGLVTIVYSSNTLATVGSLAVTARVEIAEAYCGNYELKEPDEGGCVILEATLTVSPASAVEPYPVAFASIEKVGTEWVLVATNAKQWCEYSLWGGTTLKTNEWTTPVVDWKPWTEPDGPITNRVTVSDDAQRFWILKARPGAQPVE